jgi:pimeloyl-ACP methyl ester carboxylesterase
LFLRGIPPAGPASDGDAANIVLYVHGATFPSAASVAHRFDGCSWRDTLCKAGFHVWALDFHGYGYSDPYEEMEGDAAAAQLLCRTSDASRQVETAVRFLHQRHNGARVSLIAHSWGTMAAGAFAGRYPELVERIVFFGPIARREATTPAPQLPAWKLVSAQEQAARFVADTPRHETPVLLDRHFAEWAERYLDSDRRSRTRSPPSVKVPTGLLQEIGEAWAGALAYNPALIRTPVAIMRGEWDSLCTDADAKWLFDALKAAPLRRDIKFNRGGHLMHLEEGRAALHRETVTFLQGQDWV